MKKYSNDFINLTGEQFDLTTILDSIDDECSPFWNKVFKNHYLHGLLLGFGEKNSFLFDQTYKNDLLKLKDISIERFEGLLTCDKHSSEAMQPDVTIKNLVTPYFITFDIHDDINHKYSEEKKRIIEFLENKDFTMFVLQCLSCEEGNST